MNKEKGIPIGIQGSLLIICYFCSLNHVVAVKNNTKIFKIYFIIVPKKKKRFRRVNFFLSVSLFFYYEKKKLKTSRHKVYISSPLILLCV